MEEIEDVFDSIDNYKAYLPLIKKLDKNSKIVEVREVTKEYRLDEREETATIEEYKDWTKKALANKFIKEFKNQASFTIKIDNYIENAYQFYKHQPFFYDKVGLFWFWNFSDKKYECVDDVDVMNKLDRVLGFNGQTVSRGIKSNYLEAMKRVGRLKKPKEAPLKWIQFRGKAYSLESGEIYDVTPHYFFTNPIPYEIGVSSDTPTMDNLFEEWVGKDYVQTLYEIIAYCCYRSYPIQVLFCLYGSGRNGKSCFLRLLTKFLSMANIASTELDTLLTSRFETFKLYKKLAYSIGETNFGLISKTSMIKKLVGGDTIGYEVKNKQPFDDYNYAKLMIASNSLPTSEDTSDGFYRRWNIVPFPNQFPEGKDILATIPKEEYNNLALKSCKILKELLAKGSFSNQGDIKKRRYNYIMASNPLPLFIDKCCEKGDSLFVSYNELYFHYVTFLKKTNRRKVSRKEFKSALEDEGLFVEKCSKKVDDDENPWKSTYWVDGLKFCDICDNYPLNLTQFPSKQNRVESMSQMSQMSQKKPEVEDLSEDFI